MKEHTNEPWVAVDAIIYPSNGLEGGEDWIADTRGTALEGENARRIVACVNACAGVATEFLENNARVVVLGPPIADRFAELERQRDELLAAAKNLCDVKGRHHSEQAFNALVAVVNKNK